MYICIYYTHIWHFYFISIFICEFGAHMPSLEMVGVHCLDDECFSQWSNTNFEYVWSKVLLTLLKMVDLAIDNTYGHGICFLLQALVTFYELQKSLE